MIPGKADLAKPGEWCQTVEEEDADHDDMVFVNLPDNKESYTAYDGSAVWRAIYDENCLMDRLTGLNLADTCQSETLLYQIISGLHASISLHVAARYSEEPGANETMNHEMF